MDDNQNQGAPADPNQGGGYTPPVSPQPETPAEAPAPEAPAVETPAEAPTEAPSEGGMGGDQNQGGGAPAM